MKDSTKEALFKFGEFCDSGKPWYCFFGVYLVTLIVNITLLLTSERRSSIPRPRRALQAHGRWQKPPPPKRAGTIWTGSTTTTTPPITAG